MEMAIWFRNEFIVTHLHNGELRLNIRFMVAFSGNKRYNNLL